MIPPRMTALDTRLQDMANRNWHQFIGLMPEGTLEAMKICLLNLEDKTQGQIQRSVGVSRSKARYWCDKCPTVAQPAQIV